MFRIDLTINGHPFAGRDLFKTEAEANEVADQIRKNVAITLPIPTIKVDVVEYRPWAL